MTCDLICLSPVRWDSGIQRPQQLMSRAARSRRVLFVEEPVAVQCPEPAVTLRAATGGVVVLVPFLSDELPPREAAAEVAALVRATARDLGMQQFALWASTAAAGAMIPALAPAAVVYDCMDGLAIRAEPSADLALREAALLRRADLVFVDGHSLHRARRYRHGNTLCLPSAVEVDHFGRARGLTVDPPDQARLRRPRAGFFGVIDDRIDLELLRQLAELRPELELVMLGPVVGIDPATLPQAPNLHWLGERSYAELPEYLGGWDAALLPLAHNQATRFLSPTRMFEYLAAGRPVVSTAIRDVVHPYGMMGLVRIANGARTFAEAIDAAIRETSTPWLTAADRLLSRMSWDETWSAMEEQLDLVTEGGRATPDSAPDLLRRLPARDPSVAGAATS